MQWDWKKQWKKVAGVALIVLGVLALVTPLTPGAWLIFVGAEMLGFELIYWKKIKEWWHNWKKDKNEEPRIKFEVFPAGGPMEIREHAFGHVSLKRIAPCFAIRQATRPRLADKHSLRSSCIPAPTFESPWSLQNNRSRMLSHPASLFCGHILRNIEPPEKLPSRVLGLLSVLA